LTTAVAPVPRSPAKVAIRGRPSQVSVNFLARVAYEAELNEHDRNHADVA
jgi:hypothetical protein